MKKEFGLILKDLLDTNRLTVRKFAKEIGLPHNSVNEWVGKNARFPSSPDVIKKIANYFEISVHELLFGEPESSQPTIANLLEKTEIHTGLYEISIKKVSKKLK